MGDVSSTARWFAEPVSPCDTEADVAQRARRSGVMRPGGHWGTRHSSGGGREGIARPVCQPRQQLGALAGSPAATELGAFHRLDE